MFAEIAVCLGLTLLAAGPGVEAPKTEGIDLLQIEKNIIDRTNVERAKYGRPPLVVDDKLMKSSRKHGIWMASRRTLTHSGQSGAENIAVGYSSSNAALRGWMNSSGHRANILTSGYRRIGVAAYKTAGGTIYWCQQFRR
jgi:uncharacterized protein YkwD